MVVAEVDVAAVNGGGGGSGGGFEFGKRENSRVKEGDFKTWVNSLNWVIDLWKGTEIWGIRFQMGGFGVMEIETYVKPYCTENIKIWGGLFYQ